MLLAHLLVSPLYLTGIVIGGGDGGFDLAACERAFYGRYPSGSRLRVYFLTLLLHIIIQGSLLTNLLHSLLYLTSIVVGGL